MKKYSIAFLLCFILCCSAKAQRNIFSAGSAKALTIAAGTLFNADGFALIPSVRFTITSNALAESAVPVPGYPGASIRRVYYLTSPITFTGNVRLYYLISELNGNLEPVLRYSDSTAGSYWLPSTTSTVNTGSHFIQQAMSGRTLIAATATGPDSVLAIKLLSFTGAWHRDHSALEWRVDRNEGTRNFMVESSHDGLNWAEISVVPGSLSVGQFSYHFNDYNNAFTSKLYRITIAEFSGARSCSGIIRITMDSGLDNLYVAEKHHGATIHCKGAHPTSIRVMNSIGQMVWESRLRAALYEVHNLLPGVYIVQYQLKGTLLAKQFVVR